MTQACTPAERAALAPYVSSLDAPVFALRNLPEMDPNEPAGYNGGMEDTQSQFAYDHACRHEVWRTIPDTNGSHEFSSFGRIRSWINNHGRHQSQFHIIAGCKIRGGYRRVNLRHGHRYEFFVHDLVLGAFIGPKPDGKQVRHLDGCSSNNHLDNLAYGTAQENSDDKARHGTMLRGAAVGSAKTQNEIAFAIYRSRGELTLRQASEKFSLPFSRVKDIWLGRTWSDVLAGSPDPPPFKREDRPPKMTPDQVREIRRRRVAGESGANLAREHGVGGATIWRIVHFQGVYQDVH